MENPISSVGKPSIESVSAKSGPICQQRRIFSPDMLQAVTPPSLTTFWRKIFVKCPVASRWSPRGFRLSAHLATSQFMPARISQHRRR